MKFAKWHKTKAFQPLLLVALMSLLSLNAWSQPYGGPNDGDTILVERDLFDGNTSQKIPYHRLAKSMVKRFLNFNTEKVLTFGQGKKDNVVRHFSDLADRTKYRLNVDRDEVELKFTLHL